MVQLGCNKFVGKLCVKQNHRAINLISQHIFKIHIKKKNISPKKKV